MRQGHVSRESESCAVGEPPAVLDTAGDEAGSRTLQALVESLPQLAHDLSQPLSSIASYAAGCVQRLKSGSGRPEDLLPVLERVMAEARRASDLVHEIRELSRALPSRVDTVDANEVSGGEAPPAESKSSQ